MDAAKGVRRRDRGRRWGRQWKRRWPRIDGPTGGKSRNEDSYLGGSLSPAITPGSGAARKKSGLGAIGTAAVCPCGTYLPCRGMRARCMIVELYKDEKLMPGHGAEVSARAQKEPPPTRRHIGFRPNPQSLRALMTARHDPPGKILADLEQATSNMQRGSNLRLCRGACESGGSRLTENAAPLYGARFVKRHDTVDLAGFLSAH